MNKVLAIIVIALMFATSASASVQFRGDYETGDFSQWHFYQMLGGTGCGNACTLDNVGNATGTIITSPVKQGTYAMKCVVASTGGGTSHNNRCESLASQAQTGGIAGQSWWYGWWAYIPSGQTWWPNGDDWNVLFQFFDQANVQAFIYGGVAANDGTPALYTDGPWGHKIIADPLQYNHWYHFVVHAKWSLTAGSWELRLDGKIKQTFNGRTMGQASNPSIVYSQGFYSARNTNNTVIHDGFCRASTRTQAARC